MTCKEDWDKKKRKLVKQDGDSFMRKDRCFSQLKVFAFEVIRQIYGLSIWVKNRKYLNAPYSEQLYLL